MGSGLARAGRRSVARLILGSNVVISGARGRVDVAALADTDDVAIRRSPSAGTSAAQLLDASLTGPRRSALSSTRSCGCCRSWTVTASRRAPRRASGSRATCRQ